MNLSTIPKNVNSGFDQYAVVYIHSINMSASGVVVIQMNSHPVQQSSLSGGNHGNAYIHTHPPLQFSRFSQHKHKHTQTQTQTLSHTVHTETQASLDMVQACVVKWAVTGIGNTHTVLHWMLLWFSLVNDM